jgi:pilus assembly protein CpaF
LEALGLLGGVPREALHAQLCAALRVVIQVRRDGTGRHVEEVCLLLPGTDRRMVSAVSAWRRDRGPGPAAGALSRLLEERGIRPPAVLAGGRP